MDKINKILKNMLTTNKFWRYSMYKINSANKMISGYNWEVI